ncbi:MAG: DUF3047 domain-containing protein [Proteobacteria bacterium]|mgnify:FL=1|jgi:hypothetical protein|nr:DUF3047 domain-containing protein [Pseudomonadota bacterium]MBT6193022.1 DUF3047 domain-containing protein [Pseudomonadota bacterium]MBT6464142.1 DUF3047 domain-containing protein [Pseudomonadota bacterium]MBT6674207.1 DUF3047 domain-containing protein [Pseudomonadota bacterium]MBT7247255.1 DUF3047 domain-containing protein [Pseudomonadota bacterium]
MREKLVTDFDITSVEEVAKVDYILLAGNEPPWQQTKIVITRGQQYTLLAEGQINWSTEDASLYGGPGFHLWARIPGGEIENVTRGTGTFVADVSGTIEVGIYYGLWSNLKGDLKSPTSLYQNLTGELSVTLICWERDPKLGLKKLKALSQFKKSLLLEVASKQLEQPKATPSGWQYLKEAGVSDIYSHVADSERNRIILNSLNDQGIIRKKLEFPVTQSTYLNWDWKLIEHPSCIREDRAKSHDYVSVAAEFDNGRDLTWIWSSQLDEGHYFDCPVRSWKDRETHYVVRKGDQSKNWLSESRNLFEDVKISMGFEPQIITAIWLIGVSTFQHAQASAEFSRIFLKDKNKILQVL